MTEAGLLKNDLQNRAAIQKTINQGRFLCADNFDC